jgi:CubicO group peptidase (beta-lactamase class C family)
VAGIAAGGSRNDPRGADASRRRAGIRSTGSVRGVVQLGRDHRAYRSVAEGDWTAWEIQRAEIPSTNGHCNARSIAQLGSIAAMRGVLDGQRYLSKAIINAASSIQFDGIDPISGPIRIGLGFGLDRKEFPAPTPTCFHWGGAGGSYGIMDQTTGLSCGYAMNNLIIGDNPFDDRRAERIWRTLGEVMADL